jgi:hypothetical protein
MPCGSVAGGSSDDASILLGSSTGVLQVHPFFFFFEKTCPMICKKVIVHSYNNLSLTIKVIKLYIGLSCEG